MPRVLPGRVSTILERFSRNDIRVSLDVEGIERLNRTVHHSSRQISYTLLISAMILASSVLVLADSRSEGHSILGWIGFIGFLFSFLMAAFVLLENFLRKKD